MTQQKLTAVREEIIDFERKGNVVRFYLGKNGEQWGDDWDDAPYEHNAGKVYTVSYTTTDYGKVDVVKTDTALIVNCIHALDAIYLRRIIVLANDCGICIGPLHDGYFIPFYHVDMLLFIANRAFVVDEIVEILGNVNADIPPIHSTSILL